MKTGHLVGMMLALLALAVETPPLLADGGAGPQEKQDAIAAVKARHSEEIRGRRLEYYVVQVFTPTIAPVERRVIDSGAVIVGGALLRQPYEVVYGREGLTVNGIAVEPRCRYAGEIERCRVGAGLQARSDVARLIAEKKASLYEEFGDYSLVIPELAAYAREFELVQSVQVEDTKVKVVFVSESAGGEPIEVGYLCRETRPGRPPEEGEGLRTLYARIGEWLSSGGCVFVPARGSIGFEDGELAAKIEQAMGAGCKPETKLGDCATGIEAVRACFREPIGWEEAAAIIMNWGRDLEKEKQEARSAGPAAEREK
ncbi:MAG TPA: hypothetical protein PKK06_05400 [Phycisphaerae bacterium]|nr:hypothetical protein [Phycisphaerae bacterium]HNU44807.1 hypothetical protein [Phycisphaerae bacterium]